MKSINETGLSLNLKFFLFTALIIVLMIAGTLWFSARKANALANESVRSELKQTLSVFDSFQKDRYSKLKMSNKLIAQNPYIQAYVSAADSVSILDLARQTESELGSDFIIVTDSDGTILARTDRPASSGQVVSDMPLIKRALDGEEATGYWTERQKLYNALALPVITGDVITATLVVGYGIDDSLAGQIENLTHSETAFFSTAAANEPVLIATTLSGNKEGLLEAFRNRASSGETMFELGSEKYISVFRELKNVDGKILGFFAAFRSLDRELFAFRQFQKNILWVGLGIMVLAFVLSFVGSRRITEPLRRLTDAINQVKEGNYEVPIEVNSRDEVGILAESFKKLLAELKEKAQLVEYLSQPPAQATVGNAPTIGVTSAARSMTATQATAAAIKPGAIIAGRYEVQSELGAGGMGVVLKAYDQQLDETVALKLLKDEVFERNPDAVERFKQELKLARRITHRNVVRTYDYSEMDRYHVISMEYVKGVTLKQLIRQRGTLPMKIGLQIGKQICSAIDAAHEKGVIHRDIKPQNILLENTGDVKIMDFGIARVADMKGMTSTGMVVGTPDYMSPEQAQGLTIDHRSDIYSTGVVLYEVFCGKLPFVADSPLAVLNKHIRETPPAPSSINPAIPHDLEAILLKAMAKNPEQRYGRMWDFYSALDDFSQTVREPLEKTA